MVSIPDIPQEEIQPLVGECIHPARSSFQADLYAVSWEGRPALLKDFSGRPWWVRRLWAPVAMGREFRVLRRLQGLEGIPRLLGRVGTHAILIERLAAQRLPRNREQPPPLEFFGRASELLARLHARGVGHGDLRRKNILIDQENRPYFIDFATALTAKPGPAGSLSRFAFRRCAVIDLATLARIKSDFYPDALTPREKDFIDHAPWYLKMGRFLKKKVYRLKKPHHRRALLKRMRR